ncbi:MAG: glycosyltransferase [Candidatus Saccharibacteria bacterium]
MTNRPQAKLSVVVPVYNEAAGLERFHAALMAVLHDAPLTYEVLYVDDGSLDGSAKVVTGLHAADPHVRLLKLTRNFGKEIATTAVSTLRAAMPS